MKIRIGNDFKTKWAIIWMGEPEDFSDATAISLFFNIYDKKIELAEDVNYTITDNIIEIDCTPDICNILGVYNLELHYTKPSDGFIDGERRSAVDIDAFRIVDKSDKADAIDEISSVSEAALGFQGLSAYEVWLKDNPGKTKEDYINWLRQPATDAGEAVIGKVEELDTLMGVVASNEESRVEAEQGRVEAEEEREEKTSQLWENITELTELPSFDVTKKQRVVHEFGILKWEDYE